MQIGIDRNIRISLPLFAAAFSLTTLNLPSQDCPPSSSIPSAVSSALSDSRLQDKLSEIADCKSLVNVANPIKTIYVIPEFHPDRNNLPTNLYKETIQLQRTIASIAQTTAEELGVKEVYKDGVTAKSISDIQKQVDFGNSLTEQEKKILDSDDPVSLLKDLYKSAKNEQEKQRAMDLYTYGAYTEVVRHEAVTSLAKSGIKLLETEGIEVLQAAKFCATEYGLNSEEFKLSSERREKYLVRQVMKSPARSGLIILGYNHDLTDQINDHNKNNPKAQVRLVVIKPKGIDNLAENILGK